MSMHGFKAYPLSWTKWDEFARQKIKCASTNVCAGGQKSHTGSRLRKTVYQVSSTRCSGNLLKMLAGSNVNLMTMIFFSDFCLRFFPSTSEREGDCKCLQH
jgi:hypothetical protein